MSRIDHRQPSRRKAPGEPRPWRTAADGAGWTLAARGSGAPEPPPLIRVVVDLNAEQSAWLREEAKRTGLDYVTLVERLVDEKRAAAAAAAVRRSA